MDTTQKNREATGQRTSQQGTKKSAQSARQRPQQSAQRRQRPANAQAPTPPTSVQQRNGAARTAEQQRSGVKNTAQKRSNTAATAKKRPQQTAQNKKTSTRQVGLPDSVSNKKRAYGNSKPKKKSSLSLLSSVFKKKSTPLTPEEKARKEARAEKARQRRKEMTAPAVIYTQPQAFNRNRLFVQLLTVTAVVVALVLGLSVFFKVETIVVSGAEVYSAWAVREASGIAEGDNLLSFSTVRASSQIMANLPYVAKVRIGIKLPDTVNIMIEEEDVVYAIKSSVGDWWLMNSKGEVIEQTNGGTAAGYTQVLGVTLENPVPNEKGVPTEDIPTQTDASGELIPVTVTGAQRLNTALQILKALEDNDIVGEAASVDVTRTEDIILWYGTRYQVNLGDSTKLDYKITCMNDVILQMSEYQSGILDISFTTRTEDVIYTPFG